MSASELRRAFALTESLPAKLRRLRDERIDELTRQVGSRSSDARAKLAVLLVPLSAVSLAPPLDLALIPDLEWCSRLRPIGAEGATSFRYNIDGVYVASNWSGSELDDIQSYVQLFTDGRLEAVNWSLFCDPVPQIGRPWPHISSALFESELVAVVDRFVRMEEAFSVQPPFFLLASLLDAKDYRMSPREGRFAVHTGIDRERVLLPEVVIDDYGFDGSAVLKPIFDAASRATGLPGSQYYGADGKWMLSASGR